MEKGTVRADSSQKFYEKFSVNLKLLAANFSEFRYRTEVPHTGRHIMWVFLCVMHTSLDSSGRPMKIGTIPFERTRDAFAFKQGSD